MTKIILLSVFFPLVCFTHRAETVAVKLRNRAG